MARPDQCAELLRQGCLPSQIANKLGIAASSATDYCFRAMASSPLLRTQSIRAADALHKGLLEEAIVQYGDGALTQAYEYIHSREAETTLDDLRFYSSLKASLADIGFMYGIIADVEIAIHRLIKDILMEEHGSSGDLWWRKGVPENVRVDCASLREKDASTPDHPYAYTTLTQIIDIVEKRWALFSRVRPDQFDGDKRAILEPSRDFNSLRNRIMHPVRCRPLTPDDFELASKLYRRFVPGGFKL